MRVFLGVLLLSVLFAPTAFAQRQLIISWSDNATDETSYSVQRRIPPASYGTATACSSGAVTSCQVTGLPVNTTQYADPQVTLGTTYCYQALAVNAGGNSTPSNEGCMRFRPRPVPGMEGQ